MKEANKIFKRVGTAMVVRTLLVFIGQVVGGAIWQLNPSLSGNVIFQKGTD